MTPPLSSWTIGAAAATSAAAASSAAIFGPARSASPDHPAVSRMLANCIEFARLFSEATCENNAACCVQATVSGPSSAATALNRPSSAPQSCVAAVTSPRQPRRIASASSGIVPSHEQIRWRLPVSDMTVTISRGSQNRAATYWPVHPRSIYSAYRKRRRPYHERTIIALAGRERAASLDWLRKQEPRLDRERVHWSRQVLHASLSVSQSNGARRRVRGPIFC